MSSLLSRNEPNVTENRHLYVGGSDVPVILGLSKFKTQYELAQNKTGIVKNEFKGNEYTAYGHAMEPQIREYINLTTDYEFVETSTIDEEHHIRANTDGVDHEARTLLEIKTHGTNPTIEVYKAQMQIYMFVNDLKEGVLALYERPQDFDLEFDAELLDMEIIVKRDDEYLNQILNEIELFWNRCNWLESNRAASEWDYNNCIPEHRIKGGSRPVSNELQVKTMKFEPAVVEFNYEEIEKQLEQNLKKYEGLTFTEKEATELRGVIAELRKGKRLVDQYRIKTKRQLTEPIKAFEEQCKSLNEKFDEVINPLVDQQDEFSEKQREEKRKRVEEIKDQVIEDLNLVEEVADELIIEDRFLNKSTTLKSIEEDFHEQANELILQKQNEAQMKDLIKQHVEIVNLRNELELVDSSYVHLISHKEIDDIKVIIDNDVEKLVDEREKEKRLAGAKKMKESFEKEQAKQENKQEERFIDTYEIVATEKQFDLLEEFMEENNIEFTALD